MNCPACDREVDVEWATCQGCQQRIGDYGQPVTYFAQLGAAYRQKGQHQAAAKAWQAVELLQPDYPQLQLRLGEAYVGIGRPDRAWASLQQALKQNPDAAELHFALGELTRQRGEREEAFKHYQKATQLDPQYGLAWFQVGQIYQQVRRHKEALQAYRQAVKLLPAGSDEYHQAQSHLERLSPGLPESMATGWSELIRQMTGPVTLCVLAALLDSGLRPWWIPLGGWLALALAVSGAFLYVSGTDLPRNPVIRVLAGERGLSSGDLKISLAVVGAILWLIGLALILLPVGQAYPEPPQL
jgi:tetratricopeptide (TPR) repeat protein